MDLSGLSFVPETVEYLNFSNLKIIGSNKPSNLGEAKYYHLKGFHAPKLEVISEYAFVTFVNLEEFYAHNLKEIGESAFLGTKVDVKKLGFKEEFLQRENGTEKVKIANSDADWKKGADNLYFTHDFHYENKKKYENFVLYVKIK